METPPAPPLLTVAPVRVGVLGPLELIVDDEAVRLGGPKERAVLAMLALGGGERLSRQALVEGLWADPPRTAERTVAAYLSRLRRRVAEVRPLGDGAAAAAIDDHPSGGTALLTERAVLDVATARGFAARGQAAATAGDHAWAAIAFGQALAQWRGEPLAEFDDEPFAAPARARLAEMRTTLLEQRIDAELHCGQHLVVVEELDDLVRRHPHRERLHALLMLGLYRCGRQAEALQAYDDLRRRLHVELGVDPSPAIAALQAAVLRQDAELDLPGSLTAGTTPGDPMRTSGVLTFLLTDIEDSTALWDSEPVAMAAALEVHNRLVHQHVAAHGGRTVQAQGEGDSTLNVFGRASDAVTVAVELRAALAAHEWPGGITMRVRFACHTGEAQQREGCYLGPTINRAARLRGLAAGDEIVLSEATASVVADVLPPGCWLDDVGERHLRGLRRLERVFLLRGGQAEDADPEGASDGAWSREVREALAVLLLEHDRGELHGRDVERDRLRALVRPGEEQSHRLTLIAGEPGIGKTRLAAWLAREAVADGTLVLYGRCRADLDPPFGAFLQAIGRFAAQCPVAELRRHVGSDAGELARLVPELRERLAATAAATPPDPSTERYLLLRAVAGVLRSVSQSMPLLLVLDDLHWASPSTLVLLEHLVHDDPARRLAVVGTYRDTDVGAGDPLARFIAEHASSGHVEHLQLAGLDLDSVTAWVGDAVTGGSVATVAGIGAEIHHATAGTPFFVAEAVLRLRSGGVPTAVEDARQAGTSIALSDGSRGAVQRRLAGLSSGTNKVLSVAAVVGDEFTLDVVEAVPEAAGIDVVEALDEAVRARITSEVPGSWGVYRFTHALLRQAVYTSLSDPRRVRLHRHVGEALEQRIPATGDAGPLADALARHFAEAAADGQAAKAAEYALLAANKAADSLGFEEAVSAVRHGLKALDLPGADDPGRRCDLLTALAAAQQRMFDRAGAKEAALSAAALARSIGDRERLVAAALRAAPDRWLGAAGDDVVDLLEEVLTTLDEHAPERPRLLALLAVHAAASGEGWRAGPIAEQALAVARSLPEGEPLCAALDARCWTLWGSPETLTVLALSSELIDVAHRGRLQSFVASGHFWRAQARLSLGDGDGFGADVAALADAASLTGSGIDRSRHAMLNVLRVLLDGRYDEVETLTAQANAEGAPVDPDFLYAHFAQLFWLAFERGTLNEFAPLLAGIDDAFAALPALVGVQGLVLAAGGDAAGAAAVLASPAARGLEDATGEVSWPGMIGLMTEVVMLCSRAGYDDPVIAAMLERQAAPFAERLLVVGGAICTGAGSRYLGMLASLRGDLAAVERSFTTALRLEAAAGSEPLQARTRFWYATALLRCGGEDERARAIALLGQAYAAAHRVGMVGLENAIVTALEGS